MFNAKKPLLLLFVLVLAGASLLFFEFPWTVLRPAFYQGKINTYAKEYGVDPLLVTALIKAESNFVKSAKSSTGAVGLMQLMPATAEEIAKDLDYNDFKISDLENPDVNIRFGIYYLSQLQKEFNNSILALAAYNAGRGNVRQWYKMNPMLEVELSDIPYKETREYVSDVLSNYKWLKWTQNLRKTIQKKNP